MQARTAFFVTATISILLVTACGSSKGAGGGDAGLPDGGGGASCSSATGCPGGAVCDPATGTCSTSLGCTKHAQCGQGGFCPASGICAPNTTGGPCDTDPNCPAGETCTGGFCGCVGVEVTATKVPPNVLVVLDRSSSMNDAITGGTKWTVAQSAIGTLLADVGDQIRFGLMLFPGTNQNCSAGASCGAGVVSIDPADHTTTPINSFLGGASTCHFGTPTAEALATLDTYAGLQDTSRANYVLLITDGQSTCNDPVPEVAALKALDPSVKTFVVGFGSAVDPVQLAAMADAGGTARATTPTYYQADDDASLAAALADIAGSVLSCTYSLSTVPADPNDLYIYFDGTSVNQAGDVGWTYDANLNQIIFHGASCDQLTGGQVTDLVIVYGCPIGGGVG